MEGAIMLILGLKILIFQGWKCLFSYGENVVVGQYPYISYQDNAFSQGIMPYSTAFSPGSSVK
jgi:hypothetical protein